MKKIVIIALGLTLTLGVMSFNTVENIEPADVLNYPYQLQMLR